LLVGRSEEVALEVPVLRLPEGHPLALAADHDAGRTDCTRPADSFGMTFFHSPG
jgi:hypothetical protein